MLETAFTAGLSLYRDIPEDAQLILPLNIPFAIPEQQLAALSESYSKKDAAALPQFRGAGAYRHFIPKGVEVAASLVDTAPESPGRLQALYEFEKMLCALTGMDGANTGVADGGTACLYAAVMMAKAKGGHVLISRGLHPEYRELLKNRLAHQGIDVREIPLDEDGVTDLKALQEALPGAAGVILASPNFYGCVEDVQKAADLVHDNNALLSVFTNPIALGVLSAPGDLGADIAVGEGRSLGNPLTLGGGSLGLMAAKEALAPCLPGHTVEQTAPGEFTVRPLQSAGRPFYGPDAAIRAGAFLAAMGPAGMRELAQLNLQKAHYLCDGITAIPKLKQRYDFTPFFNEFVIDGPKASAVVNATLKVKGFIGGMRLGRYEKEDNGILYCATECNTREEIDAFFSALEVCVK